MKFRILEEEGLYYPCSENKGADQLRGYREAGLRLCFRICKLLVFSCTGSSVNGLRNVGYKVYVHMLTVDMKHQMKRWLLYIPK